MMHFEDTVGVQTDYVISSTVETLFEESVYMIDSADWTLSIATEINVYVM